VASDVRGRRTSGSAHSVEHAPQLLRMNQGEPHTPTCSACRCWGQVCGPTLNRGASAAGCVRECPRRLGWNRPLRFNGRYGARPLHAHGRPGGRPVRLLQSLRRPRGTDATAVAPTSRRWTTADSGVGRYALVFYSSFAAGKARSIASSAAKLSRIWAFIPFTSMVSDLKRRWRPR
jgi:hypothetical protein